MEEMNFEQSVEEQIGQWRNYLLRRQAIHAVDVDELEDHLREQISGLLESGLAIDEAFLIAVKRLGKLDELSREFAREHSDRLWKQLVIVSDSVEPQRFPQDAIVAVCLAVAAAVAIKVPALFGLQIEQNDALYARNMSLFVLPFLSAYFAWKRQLKLRTIIGIGVVFVLGGVIVNIYPHGTKGDTLTLSILHLPIVFWSAVGMAYMADRWLDVQGRMDFIRFSGEWFIYYVLIALGGGVLTGFMVMIFQAIGIDIEPFFGNWMLPCGAMGAVVIGSWLVEAKQSVVENMAPVLTQIFTPLFVAALMAFLVTLVYTGNAIDINRNVLIAFDLLLCVVLGLVLYSVSARDPRKKPGLFDGLQIALLISALLADLVALWAIASRISEFGFTPNRVAALGENIILLVNLVWSTVLYLKFLRGQGSFDRLEKWQTDYLPVYAIWAALVVVVFPPLFGFI